MMFSTTSFIHVGSHLDHRLRLCSLSLVDLSSLVDFQNVGCSIFISSEKKRDCGVLGTSLHLYSQLSLFFLIGQSLQSVLEISACDVIQLQITQQSCQGHSRSQVIMSCMAAGMISKGNQVTFVRFVLLAVSEEARTQLQVRFFVQFNFFYLMDNKTIIVHFGHDYSGYHRNLIQ